MQKNEKFDDLVPSDEGNLLFNPFNPLNREITLPAVQSILVRYGLPPLVRNMQLYRRAFIHRSYTRKTDLENALSGVVIAERPPDCLPLSTKSNENLEYLGDGVLEGVTKYLLYRRFPKSDEGFKTTKKIALVNNEAIGQIALDMGLNHWLILSRNAEEKKLRNHLKTLGCLFEAFIGAIFLDYNQVVISDSLNQALQSNISLVQTQTEEDGGDNMVSDALEGEPHVWFQAKVGPGFQMAQQFIENVFQQHVNWISVIQNDDNFKNILQIKIQKEFKVTPHYLEMGYDEVAGYQVGVFLCLNQPIHSCRIAHAIPMQQLGTFEAFHKHMAAHEGRLFVLLGSGQHKKKKKAEQIACKQAIDWMHENNGSGSALV